MLKTISYHKSAFFLLISVLIVYGLSFYKRHETFNYWTENPEKYFIGDVVAMSTMDAYYWIRMAKEVDKGNIGKNLADETRGYPDMVPFAIQDSPGLLAELISWGTFLTDGNYYRSGLLLVPILSGLFIFPLFFYFQRIGFGSSAILGGLIGTFSHAYYDRTMMGRVDTDLLNTFFPILTACFILPINRERKIKGNMFLALGAGLTLNIFTWWYQQPSFIFVFLCFLVIYLAFIRIDLKHIALLSLVFLGASGPGNVLDILTSIRTFLWAYVAPPPIGGIAWPNILDVVSEAKNRGLENHLENLHGFLPIVFAGFGGVFFLYIRHFKKMIPITPVVLLGCWTLSGPSRFAMYLAPFIGVGAGVIIELLVNAFRGKFNFKVFYGRCVSVSLVFLLFFATSTGTGFSYHPQPVLSSKLTRTLLDIKQEVPENSAMYTPFWEFGYPLMDIGEFATYHDGGLQGGIRSTLTAQAMVSHNQEDIVSLLSFLEEYGFHGLLRKIREDNLSPDQMLDLVFNYSKDFSGKNVFILYLEDMIFKYGSMAKFGLWDFEKRTSQSSDYFFLDCFSISNNIVRCQDGIIDLESGFMHEGNNKIPVKSVLWVDNGYVNETNQYARDNGYYVQFLMKDGKMKLILVADEVIFMSNFNQQYILGNYDKRYYKEIYNNYPDGRVFKVIGN